MIVVPYSIWRTPPPSISEPRTKIKVWHLPFFLLLEVREECPVDPVRESVARLIWRRRWGVLLPLSSPCARTGELGNRITRQTKTPRGLSFKKNSVVRYIYQVDCQ